MTIPLDSKEIRGLTVKHVITILACTISVIGTLVWGYANIVNQLQKNQLSTEVLQMQINTLKTDQQTTNIRLTILETKVNESEKAKP